MSFIMTSLVASLRLPPDVARRRVHARAVLGTLAAYSDSTGRGAFPSLDTIASETEIGRTKVPEHLAALARASAIGEEATPRQWRPRTYYLQLDVLNTWIEPRAWRRLSEDTRTKITAAVQAYRAPTASLPPADVIGTDVSGTDVPEQEPRAAASAVHHEGTLDDVSVPDSGDASVPDSSAQGSRFPAFPNQASASSPGGTDPRDPRTEIQNDPDPAHAPPREVPPSGGVHARDRCTARAREPTPAETPPTLTQSGIWFQGSSGRPLQTFLVKSELLPRLTRELAVPEARATEILRAWCALEDVLHAGDPSGPPDPANW